MIVNIIIRAVIQNNFFYQHAWLLLKTILRVVRDINGTPKKTQTT